MIVRSPRMRQKEVIMPAKKKLSPYAKAYYDLWWKSAGMGEVDDVEMSREAYLNGELTDADLAEAVPDEWRGRLPPLHARRSTIRSPAKKKARTAPKRASRSNGVRSPSYPFLVVERMTGRVQAGAETRNGAEDMRHDLPTPAADLQVLTREGVRRKFGRISWASVATMRNPQRPDRANGATFVKVVGDRTRGSTVRGARHNYRTVEVLVYQSPNSMATARTYEIVTDASYNMGDGAYTTDVWKLPEPVAVQQAIYTAVRNLRGGGRNRRAPVPAE